MRPFFVLPVLVLASCASVPEGATGTCRVIPVEDVEFTKLNPARGDASPLAGTVWGDRQGPVATGFLFRPVDGFESPPHIHNVTYRGVVIRGEVHNAHPTAPTTWMPAGSFWTQPKGQVHITSARGDDTLAYIEIDEGPYLVWPKEDRFEVAERSVNVDASNLVWTDVDDVLARSGDGPRVATLWSRGDLRGVMLELGQGDVRRLRSDGDLHAVVVRGTLLHRTAEESETARLRPGSAFLSTGAVDHRLTVEDEPVALYLRTSSAIDLR